MANSHRSRYTAKQPKDERTKFDKWLDECATAKRPVFFVMYDDEQITCVPVVIDRYMIQVDLSEDEEPDLVWLNKGAMVKAGNELATDDDLDTEEE